MCNPKLDHIDPGDALCDANTRCWRYNLAADGTRDSIRLLGE